MADETAEPQAPIVAAAAADAVATQADAAVEIAEIDANARVEVETLAQETARAAIEADKERATAVTREEIEWLRNKAQETEQALSSLSTRTTEIAQTVETSQAEILRRLEALTPPPPVEIQEEVITPPQIPPSAEEAAPKVAENQPGPVPQRRPHRLI